MIIESITHFSVGRGNCSVIEADNFVMIIDLNHTEDKESSYDLLKPFFRKKNGKDYIDVLYITHGDEDHCLGFKKFREEIDKGNLVIGVIWHQDFDRNKKWKKGDPELPEDYIELQKEIDRRRDISNPDDGDIEIALKAKDDDSIAFKGIKKPDDFELKVLSPFEDDDEDSGYCHNDLSLIIKFTINGKTFLYTGDASSKYWQERIIPELLDEDEYSDWAEAEVLEVGHHGSYDFFGQDRAQVRTQVENSDNYEALDRINPTELVVSAAEKFPTSRDSSGDEPPHYAAWKCYHKWFRDNRGVKSSDEHPDEFKYTSAGNLRLEYENNGWGEWILNWDHNSKEENNSNGNGNNYQRAAADLEMSRRGPLDKPFTSFK